MKTTRDIGLHSEEIAVNFLIHKGYEILEQNYRYKRSEIDIIARLDELVVFVEVKKRSGSLYGNPEDFVTDEQIERIQLAAENYLIEKEFNGPIRFDIISITEQEGKELIDHFEDAF